MPVLATIEKDYKALKTYLKNKLGYADTEVDDMIKHGEGMQETHLKSGRDTAQAEQSNKLAQPETMDARTDAQNAANDK